MRDMRWYATTRVFFFLSLLFLAACDPARGVPVFLWHSVGEGSPSDNYDLSPEEFDRELSLLEEYGATTITLDQLYDARYGSAKLPKRAVILTFDDGRASLYRSAMPILLKHKMVAEVFVVASFVADEKNRHVEKDSSGSHEFLTWAELAEMNKSGAFKIESHSLTHRKHVTITREEKHSELADSRRLLSERLGVPINFYAYPLGGFDTWYRDEAERVGYRGAMAVQKGPGTRYAVLRSSIHRNSERQFQEALERSFGALKK